MLDFREGALFEAHAHDDHDGDHDEHGDEDHDDHEHEEHDDHDHEEHADEDEHDHEEHDHEEEHDDHEHEEEHGEHDHEEHADEDHDAHDHEEEHADHDEHDHEDHADHEGHEGHDHGEHDPHAWLSPTNAAVWMNVIAAELSAADPENAGTYFANAAEGIAELEALAAEVSETLAPVAEMNFIVFHDAYQYFETDFGISAAGAISLGDATDPSPARIAEIQGRIEAEGIDCVLTEPQYNPGLIETVLGETEATTAVIDPLGAALEPGADLYPQLIRNMAATLASCG